MKYLYSIIFFLIIFPFNSFTQYSKEQKKLLKTADEYFYTTDYWNALNLYKKLLQSDSTSEHINYNYGVCIYKIGNKRFDSQQYFEKISNKDKFAETYYHLAQLYHLQNQFDKAIAQYELYKKCNNTALSISEIDRLVAISKRAKNMLAHPTGVVIKNIGKAINTEYSEYVPLITADESMLLFTSRREGSTGGLLDPYNRFFEDIYFSTRKNNEWDNAQNIATTINTATHDACVGLSNSGNLLILFRTNQELTGGDLYISELQNGQWSSPEIIAEKNINTEWQEASASLSPDDNLMYFSSNRPGGYGGKDIYRAIRFGNGEWSLPINLGASINTPYDDDAPFIHPDGKTLYFSSKGHTTMGGFDIFKTSMDDAGNWTTPQNLGYPINTVNDDIYFVLSANAKHGYFSSERESGFGGQDIYIATMDGVATPIIKGEIISNDSVAIPLKAKITLINDETNDLIGIYQSNAVTGKYIMVISPEIKYRMTVEADGFEMQTEMIFTNKDEKQEWSKDIQLKRK